MLSHGGMKDLGALQCYGRADYKLLLHVFLSEKNRFLFYPLHCAFGVLVSLCNAM